MSNDIILSIKNNLPVTIGVDDETAAVAGKTGVAKSGGGSKRISIKGGVFRKYVGGKEVGTVEDRHMNVVFVKMSPTASRTYYTGAYKEGERVSPACWSSNSETPDPEVKNPQSSACATCQWSVKGSGQGGTSAACRMSWRTAVVLPQMPDGDVMQLVIPGASVWGPEEAGKWRFRPYVQMLAANNVSAGRVITKMQFDMNSSSPRLWFSPVAPVNADEVELLANQARSEAAERAVKLTVFQQDGGDAPVEAEVEVEAPPVPEPVLRESKKTTEAPTDVSDVVRKWSKK